VKKRRQTKSKVAKPYIVVDTREQKPWVFIVGKELAGCRSVKLDYGDYQIDGRPDLIAIERKKSVDELCTNIGQHRERFERELQRMQACKYRFVVIEDSWYAVAKPKHSRMHWKAILASIATFEIRYGVHFVFANNRRTARLIALELIVKAWKEDQDVNIPV